MASDQLPGERFGQRSLASKTAHVRRADAPLVAYCGAPLIINAIGPGEPHNRVVDQHCIGCTAAYREAHEGRMPITYDI